jgi:hypothetical protein
MSLEDNAMRFNAAAYALAQQRAKSAPLELTEHDFDQLATISTRQETEAREAQKQAQLAIVQANAAKSAPLQTKAAPAAPETMEEFLARYGTKHVSYQTLYEATGALLEKWAEMNERNKERNRRLDALEQSNAELSARILELEAQRAAKSDVLT